MEGDETPLLRISLDGEVGAEAILHIYDGRRAWTAFQEAFANLAPYVVGELFNTVRIACHGELQAERGSQGIIIDLESGSRHDDLILSAIRGRYREDEE